LYGLPGGIPKRARIYTAWTNSSPPGNSRILDDIPTTGKHAQNNFWAPIRPPHTHETFTPTSAHTPPNINQPTPLQRHKTNPKTNAHRTGIPTRTALVEITPPTQLEIETIPPPAAKRPKTSPFPQSPVLPDLCTATRTSEEIPRRERRNQAQSGGDKKKRKHNW
jgi:hypothetical protein